MKTRKIYTSLMLSGMILICGACGDFLEERSQNMAYVENVGDLDELLIGEGYLPGGYSLDEETDAKTNSNWTKITQTTPSYFPYIHLMDDDATEYLIGSMGTSEKNYIRLKAGNLHHWQPDPFFDSNNTAFEDKNWSECWKRIAAMNSIVYQVGEMRGHEEDKQRCDKVEGEARFLRAQYYFWMANLYGRPYAKATAKTDLCIPLKTSEVIEDRFFERASGAEVYDQMVEDLTRSANLLRGVLQPSKYRANQAAAFALLSRVFLYMERYEEAIACADSVLAMKYDLLDFNLHKMGESAVYVNSPEVIFTQGPNIMALLHSPAVNANKSPYTSSSYTSSADLLASYTSADLRLRAFFIERPAPASGFRCVKTLSKNVEVSDHFAIRLPEVYLNKAEALALLGRDIEARQTIDILRQNRFADADFTETTESGNDLVNFIRDERRRELCYEGHRWFDLRRYAVNSVCPFTKSIEHVYLNQTEGAGIYEEGKYVLRPYPEDQAAYILPIPTQAIDFNEGSLTNEVRPERKMIVVE